MAVIGGIMTLMLNTNNSVKKLLLLHIILLIMMLSIAATACEPPGPEFRIVNPTTQDLIIFIDGYLLHTVRYDEDVSFRASPGILAQETHLFEARNRRGDLFFSEELTLSELEARDWTIVIPSSPELYLSNKSKQAIVVFIDGNPVLEPIRTGFPIVLRLAVPIGLNSEQVKYRIEALNQNLEVVFSQEFTYRELTFMGWSIKIPPENE